MYQNTSTTPEEFFKYFCKDEQAKEFFEKYSEYNNAEIKESENAKNRIERLEEQLYFANDLLDEIEEMLSNTTRMNDFKKSFTRILENSYFER